MTDATTLDARLATLGGSGWAINALAEAGRSFQFTVATTFTVVEAGLYRFSGCGGGGGGGHGEAALNGGGGGGGGAGRAKMRVPIWLAQNDVVVVTPGAAGAATGQGGDTIVTVNGLERLRIKGSATGGTGAAGAGGVGGAVTGSFQGSPSVAAGASAANRSTYPDMHGGLSCTGSGGGAAALSAGLGCIAPNDNSRSSSGLSGGGHGGSTIFAGTGVTTDFGGGGAAGVNGTAPTATNYGAGGGGGGAAASPGLGTAGAQGVLYMELPMRI
jgi:hypothetical protein